MAEKRKEEGEKENHEDVDGRLVVGRIQIKKKFLKRARALQPVLLDPLNIQTGVAASIISNLIEGRLVLIRKGRA